MTTNQYPKCVGIMPGILVIVNSAEEHAALIDSEIRIMTRLVVGGVIVLAVWVAVILWILA
jgi:hypothetical protein